MEKSFDAIGLMKQVGEHTAAAYAEAQEVLSNSASGTKSKERLSSCETGMDQEQYQSQHNQLGNCSSSAPKLLVSFIYYALYSRILVIVVSKHKGY